MDLLRFFYMYWIFSIAYSFLIISLVRYRLSRKEDYLYILGISNNDRTQSLVKIHRLYVGFANFLLGVFTLALPGLLWAVVHFPAEGMLPPISEILLMEMLSVMVIFGIGIHFIRPKRRELPTISP